LERATELTIEPARRAQRALAAAQAKHQAGAPDAALELLDTARTGPLDELGRARMDLLRAEIAFAARRGREAPPLLLEAAKRLEPLDVTLARETYLDALSAAIVAGQLASGGGVLVVAQAARAAPAASQPLRAADLLLDGLALLFTEGYAAGAPVLKRALSAFRSQELTNEEGIRWLWLAGRTAAFLWYDEHWDVLSARQVQLARDAGALTVLPIALSWRIGFHKFAGESVTAASLVEEQKAVTEATGSHLAPYSALSLAALRGREAEVCELIEATKSEVVARGEGIGLAVIELEATRCARYRRPTRWRRSGRSRCSPTCAVMSSGRPTAATPRSSRRERAISPNCPAPTAAERPSLPRPPIGSSCAGSYCAARSGPGGPAGGRDPCVSSCRPNTTPSGAWSDSTCPGPSSAWVG
jgi:hypothetical protein